MIIKFITRFLSKQWDHFIITVFLIYQSASNFYKSGFWIGDLGREIYAPLRILDGQILYKDFSWLYGPFSIWINSVLYKVFSINIQPLYYLSLILSLLIALLVYHLSNKFLPKVISLLITLIFIKVSMFGFTWQSFILPGKFASLWSTFFTLIVLNLLLNDAHKKYRTLLIGAISGLVAVTKIDFFMAVSGTVFVYLLLSNLNNNLNLVKKLYIYIVGILTVVLPALLILSIQKASLPEVINNIFPSYASGFWFSHRSFYDFPSLIKTFWIEAIIITPVIVASFSLGKIFNLLRVIILLFVFFIIWRFNLTFIQFTFFQTFNIFFGIFFILAIAKIRKQSFSLFILLIFTLLLTFRDKFSLSGMDMVFPLIGFLGSLNLLSNGNKILNKKILNVSLASILFLLFLNQNTYLSSQYSDKLIAKENYRGNLIINNSSEKILFDAIDYIRKNTRPSSTLLSLPLETSINFFAGRSNPTHYDQYVNGIIPPNQQPEIINELSERRPTFITVSNYDFLGYFGIDYDNEIFDWIKNNYHVIKTFGCTYPYDIRNSCSSYGITMYESDK